MDLSRRDRCQFGLGTGSRPLLSFRPDPEALGALRGSGLWPSRLEARLCVGPAERFLEAPQSSKRWTHRFGGKQGQPDGLFASNLPGLPLPLGLGAPSPAGGPWAPELPRLPASVRSPWSTAPGSLSLGL